MDLALAGHRVRTPPKGRRAERLKGALLFSALTAKGTYTSIAAVCSGKPLPMPPAHGRAAHRALHPRHARHCMHATAMPSVKFPAQSMDEAL